MCAQSLLKMKIIRNMFRLLTFLNKILNIKLKLYSSCDDVVKEGLPNYYYPDDTGTSTIPLESCLHNVNTIIVEYIIIILCI